MSPRFLLNKKKTDNDDRSNERSTRVLRRWTSQFVHFVKGNDPTALSQAETNRALFDFLIESKILPL